ncbi:MAG TPA: hypothetical protein VFO41_14420 [Alphaproteobacteria bacterium]|nr:hypothetical protein [Alphaproteobacteria bacterium]
MTREDQRIGIRWTIGNVSPRGFEALRLSIWGAYQAFGPEAAYLVCVNTLTCDQARARTGPVPDRVEWQPAGATPDLLQGHLDPDMAEGVAWKFAPLRFFPNRYEIALDNDCILWAVPDAVRRWLDAADAAACLMAEDVKLALGQFEDLCGPRPVNSGIRGLPPGFDLGAAIEAVLARRPVMLHSELDEQGLQAAALSRKKPLHIVSLDEVTICSPFWPHVPRLGRHGAHFVGLNARDLPWTYYDRPAVDCIAENWANHATELRRRVGCDADLDRAPLP